jgi:cell division septal protein FtsQ
MPLLRPRKKTTRSQRSHNTTRRGGDIQKLHIKVNSPRIVMIQIMRGVAKGLKLAILLAMLGMIGWGGYKGVRHVFIDNEKYRLQEIKLETNGHLDHARVVSIAGIDLDSSIFAIDADQVRDRLKSQPEVIECSVKHRLPGTLHISITERVPVVWIECAKLGFPGRINGGILADKDGITFPCEGNLWQTAENLPVIVIHDATDEAFIHGTTMKHSEALRALHLIKMLNDNELRTENSPERVTLLTNYSMEAHCNDGTRATFGMYEHKRQIADFIKICDHTRQNQRIMTHVNLIPKKNIPVKFAGGPVLVHPQHN